MNNRKYWGNNASQKAKQTIHQVSDVIKAATTKKIEQFTPEKKTTD